MLDHDEFLAQFQTAQALEGAYKKRLTDVISAQPAFGDEDAVRTWLATLVGALQDCKQWGEAFVRLIDGASAGLAARTPAMRESRLAAQRTVDEMQLRLQEMGFEDEP